MSHKLFYYLVIFLSTFLPFRSFCKEYQEYSYLKKADSLFASQQYVEAMEVYEDIFAHSGQFSFQMLLKMAFIKEALGDYTSALYYLNTHHYYSSNHGVLKKMEDIAAKYKLNGYRYTDLEYFMALYHHYYYLPFCFIGLMVFYYIYLISKRFRGKSLGIRPVLLIIIMTGVFYLANFDMLAPKGIIKNRGVFLMSAPSAASDPIAYVHDGHRVDILGKNDVWYKISWAEQEAYILENNLLLIGKN